MPSTLFHGISAFFDLSDSYSQLAEQYGNDVASEVVAKSRSNLHLDVIPNVSYDNRH